ncbi:MAG: galactokinase [Erysipelotrichaceae bacterium]|nr:MAG: GHMP kinase N-terminal domain [Erysipelotrichaceae bacterium]TXT17989.1 MAG: galactokinase [Erysipelotrichaceae bacterium]
MNTTSFSSLIQSIAFEETLNNLYGSDQFEFQKTRYADLAQRFNESFPNHDHCDVFSASGRIEIGGNHTDHQLGRVLAMAVDLDTVAFVSPNQDNIIRLISKNYSIDPIDLSDLSIHPSEYYTTMGILRGLAYYFKALNGSVGGFDAVVESRVLSGSGMSSSASIEVLIAKILDSYYGAGTLDVSDYAIMAQKAENNYFNKPCGLMDQMVIAHGGFCAIDFYDMNNPIVTKVDSHGLFEPMDLCLVQCGGSHADLSQDYAEIFEDCRALSHYFNQEVLSRVKSVDFYAQLPSLHTTFDTRVLLRAHHFFQENDRVLDLMSALNTSDRPAFLNHILASGRSSHLYLQNVMNRHESKQGLALALMMAEHDLNQQGAFRVHGGGFAGTILMFVPKKLTALLKVNFNAVFGEDSFIQVRLREAGVIQVF